MCYIMQLDAHVEEEKLRNKIPASLEINSDFFSVCLRKKRSRRIRYLREEAGLEGGEI